MLWKKIILKGNTTAKYIEYKHKNTGTSSLSPFTDPNYSILIHPWNVEKQYH